MAKLDEVRIGEKYGRLKLLSTIRESTNQNSRYRNFANCECDCGKKVKIRLDSLGTTIQSCGCLNLELTRLKGLANKKHGMSKTGTYKSWAEMWARCTNENHEKYQSYKNRRPPESWRDFEVFLKDMGEKPEGYSIERVDNDKPYGPENCKWIPMPEQASNTSTVRKVTNGILVVPLSEAAKLESINYKTVQTRLNQLGWPLSEALTPSWRWVDQGKGDAAQQVARNYIRPDRK